MADMKTKPNEKDVVAFLDEVEDEQRRADCFELLKLFTEVTKEPPKMWGPSMIGFGSYHYKYASGREGDWFLTGFSPRKQNLTIYITAGFKQYDEIMEKLGKYKTGSSCLYVKKLSDVNRNLLKKLVKESVVYMKEKY
ncbi:MAG: DUF1801 domain-containing protein [Balneolaceae bacterium]